jgi:2-dehydropantoate 2-reductase
MGRRIAIVGAGAVGGYAGAHMVRAGEDVTFIDPWPEHVEQMRRRGLRVTHAMDVEEFSVPVRALHITDAQHLSKEAPVDIAFVCMKSYDTAWATMLIRQYLAPDGFVVSLARAGRRTPCFAPARCTAGSRRARKKSAA